MPMLEGPDCRLWIQKMGRGAPVTVFAHGVTSSVDELGPVAARTPGTRVLLDFRGHGRSESPPDARYDHAAMRSDLACVADVTGATRAFGISMGAGALLNLLADQPDRFERVGLFLPASIDGLGEGAAAPLSPLAYQLERHSLEEVVELTLNAPEHQVLFDRRPQWRTLVRERILRMNSTGVPRALRAYAGGAPPVEDAEALRRVRVPVLILAHEGDPIHEVSHARRLARLLPNARLEVWPEPLAMYDDVDSFAALIGEFLGA